METIESSARESPYPMAHRDRVHGGRRTARHSLSALSTIVVLGFGAANVAVAQGTRVALDLDVSVERQQVPRDTTIALSLENLAPSHSYSVAIERRRLSVDSLPSDALKSMEAGFEALMKKQQRDEDCSAIRPAIQHLWAVREEADIPEALVALRLAVDACPSGRTTADSVAALTRRNLGLHELGRNEELVVTVKRDRESDGQKTWEFILTTGTKRRFLAHYGLALLPDRDEHAFTVTADSAFMVREGDAKSALAPTVLFTLPFWRADYSAGLTAGFGLDLHEPSGLLGLSFILGDHVLLTLGGALTGKKELADRYKDQANRMVAEPLDSEQLLTDEAGPHWFVGLAFAFPSSPFGGRGTESTANGDE